MKLIKIKGKRTVKITDSFGKKKLYPNGTKRIVERWTLFNGWVRFKEKAKVKYICGSDGTIYYNDWIKIKRLT